MDAALAAILLAPSYCAKAQAYFARAGGLSSAQKKRIDTLIRGLIADGDWPLFDNILLFANETQGAALIDLVSLRAATAVNSPTFTSGQGFAGNGTTSYINTNWNPSTMGVAYALNSSHIAVYDRTARSDAASVVSAGVNATNVANVNPRFNSTSGGVLNNVAGISAAAPANAAGWWCVTRSDSVNTFVFRNGVQHTTGGADTSVAIPNGAVFVGGRNNAGALELGTTDQHAIFTAGGLMPIAAQPRISARFNAYMTSLGANVF